MLSRLAMAALLGLPAAAQDYRITAGVNLVVLSAAVTDSHGRPVPGLRKENFVLREEDRPCDLQLFAAEDAPVTAGLIIDGSSSMWPKRAAAGQAALAFVRSSHPADEIFVLNFNDTVRSGLPDALPFTADPALLAAALERSPAAGRTALYDGIAAGLAHLNRGSHDRKVLVIFSDGGDNASRRTYDDIAALVQQSDATIYTIGLFNERDEDRNPGVLKRLAKVTGGAAFLPGGTGDIDQICRRIARDVRSRYTLGYAPLPAAAPGSFRRIRVTAAAPGFGKLFVRTRAGYRVPAPPAEAGGPL
jgi:Ca-activated chloride channel family protein